MNPDIIQSIRMFHALRQAFCTHKQSFAYRKYDDFVFVEFSNCSRCGKTLDKFSGFDEDMRG
jgi:hypothetical protein